jgi:uncharacterized UPF0146 family protein
MGRLFEDAIVEVGVGEVRHVAVTSISAGATAITADVDKDQAGRLEFHQFNEFRPAHYRDAKANEAMRAGGVRVHVI